MMRSDMPKQIMAYRNGGGLPSLATVPMEFSNGGGILSKLKSGIASIGSQIKSDIKEIMDNAGKPISEQSQAYREKTEASKKNLEIAASRRKKRRKKRRARQAAAEAAAAAAEQQGAATTTATVDGGITTLDPGVADQSIINMVNQRDDLTAAQKLEFAQSLGANLGVPDGAGVQFAVENLSNVALDPTSGLSDADRVSALTTLGTATGTDYSGLINTLNNQIAANNLANINTIATTTPGANMINNVATTPAVNTSMTPVAPATYTGYAPIVPAANVSTAGIAGLPSTDTSTIQPYTFTAFTPEAYTPAVNPLVLPPLG
tara:strand:- start:211 stop:1167 length:957 start_codon:yes stop_codon:yes gene_type:complete